MPIRRDLLIITALLALVGVLALSLRYVEWVEKAIDTGFSEAAQQDPFLAGSLFLERFGIASERAPSVAMLDQMPAIEDVIIMTNTRRTLSRKRVDALLRWAESGGRLILVAVEADSDQEPGGAPILEQVGVSMSYVDADSNDAFDGIEDFQIDRPAEVPTTVEEALDAALYVTPESCLEPAELTTVAGDRAAPIAAEFWQDNYLRFEERAILRGSNRDGLQLLMVPWGSGTIVALTSIELWESKHIHCHDNAHLLRTLSADRQKVWWIFDTEMEPLTTIIAQRWPWLVVLAALWLLAWCWHSALRLRAPSAQQAVERRNVMEHIDGIARFHYQQSDQNRLLQHLRRQCPININDPTAIEGAAQDLGESPERIRWALATEISNNTNDFTAAVQLLQRLKIASRHQRAAKEIRDDH